MSYDDIRTHQRMLQDELRTEGLRQAIDATVREGDAVLDFGCGTGILSFFARKAGARTVYAVDRSPILKVAQQVAADNGITGIHFISGDGDSVALPEKVDVVVSEWMGHFIFLEDMLRPLGRLIESYLRPGGLCVPRTVTPTMGLVTDKLLHDEYAFFSRRRYGIDFSHVAKWPYYDPELRHLHPGQVDVTTMTGESIELRQARDVAVVSGEMIAERALTVYALAGWFTSEFAPGVEIRTGPHDPETHWKQVVFPLAEPIQVAEGSTVKVKIYPLRIGPARVHAWRWAIESSNERRLYDSVMHHLWLHR